MYMDLVGSTVEIITIVTFSVLVLMVLCILDTVLLLHTWTTMCASVPLLHTPVVLNVLPALLGPIA